MSEPSLDRVIANQVQLVERIQRVFLNYSDPGQDLDPETWAVLPKNLGVAVDKLATLLHLEREVA